MKWETFHASKMIGIIAAFMYNPFPMIIHAYSSPQLTLSAEVVRPNALAWIPDEIPYNQGYSPEAWFRAAQEKGHHGEPGKAYEFYSHAIRLNPMYAEAYFYRGYSAYFFAKHSEAERHLIKEQLDEACNDIKKAIELGFDIAKEFKQFPTFKPLKEACDYAKSYNVN